MVVELLGKDRKVWLAEFEARGGCVPTKAE